MQRTSRSTYTETRARSVGTHGQPDYLARGSNPCSVIGEEGIVQIDATMHPRFALNWIRSVREITDKPFLYLINTDHHQDHIMCNALFGARIVNHKATDDEVRKLESFEPQNVLPFVFPKHLYLLAESRDPAIIASLRQRLATFDEETRKSYDGIRHRAADITFEDRITINLGDVSVEAFHVGGHAVGSTLVYVPEEKVLFGGDSIFNDLMPNIEEADTARWIDVITAIEAMDVETIVPGHGDPSDKAPLAKLKEYILLAREGVAHHALRGLSRAEVVDKVDLGGFFPANDGLGWSKKRNHDWSRDNVGHVFDEFAAAPWATAPALAAVD
jgi:glyoxylase-like metal-dependent hydrolase (beta-lactamase superfamily II)